MYKHCSGMSSGSNNACMSSTQKPSLAWELNLTRFSASLGPPETLNTKTRVGRIRTPA